MTACLYLSPPISGHSNFNGEVIPILMADTMVTLLDPDRKRSVLPTTISSSDNMERSSVKLVRKLNILNQYAWTCAGGGDAIRNLCRDLRDNAADWAHEERPMQLLGKLADARRVETLGVYVRGTAINIVNRGARFNFPHLGVCAAIGSGATALLDECHRVVPQLDGWLGAGPFDKVRRFLSAINGKRLAEEITGEAKDRWGGYCEWAASFDDSWNRGPKAINLFYIGELEENGNIGVSIYPRSIAYDPRGSLLSMTPEGDFPFHLEDMIRVDSQQAVSNSEWATWEPDWATVTIAIPGADGKYIYRTKSYDMTQPNPIIFRNNEISGRSFGMDLREMDNLLHKVVMS